MEVNFLRSQRIGGYESLYDSAIAKFLILLILTSLLAPLIMTLFKKRSSPEDAR